jgi:hypothetical protein
MKSNATYWLFCREKPVSTVASKEESPFTNSTELNVFALTNMKPKSP